MTGSYTPVNNLINGADNDNLADQLTHVNREMYKKNLELADRNKTLSLLRKIDEIILTSVTDIEKIAQHIAKTVTEDIGFKAVFIFLADREKHIVAPLAVSTTKDILNVDINLQKVLYSAKFSFDETENLIIKTIKEKRMNTTDGLYPLLKSHLSKDACNALQAGVGATSFVMYPLLARGDAIGAILIGMDDGDKPMSQFEKWRDLIERLPGVVSIAIDNALLYKEIQEANEKLKILDELKDEFVSVASHELRTPMTAIKSYLWMALAGKGGELNEKLRLYLDRAYNSTDRLIKLVNDMLNISRIESGRMSFQFAETNIEDLVLDMAEEVKPRAEELGIAVTVEKPNTILPHVVADQDKIKEVLINLIGNSLKFTPKGGSIRIHFDTEEEMTIVHVSDSGAGISEDDLPRLFTKFGLIEHSYVHNKSSQGTGLGLYICKNIIDLHKGKIWVYSKGKGYGTTFSFSLIKFNQKELDELNAKLKGKEGINIVRSRL